MRQLDAPGGVGFRPNEGCALRSTTHPETETSALVVLPAASTRKGGTCGRVWATKMRTDNGTVLVGGVGIGIGEHGTENERSPPSDLGDRWLRGSKLPGALDDGHG